MSVSYVSLLLENGIGHPPCFLYCGILGGLHGHGFVSQEMDSFRTRTHLDLLFNWPTMQEADCTARKCSPLLTPATCFFRDLYHSH